jgi:hypothetical protein
MFLAVARFELNGCFRTLICRYSGDQGMGKFAPKPPSNLRSRIGGIEWQAVVL